MTKRMLIDATHDEETRVAVVDDNNNRLLEFDYESKFRKPLKGSIFLAKVTRVEPSLQAAFVNFGGNRHGFLPFSEIHPDYYRIPISDREALLAEQEKMLAEEEEREEAEDLKGAGKNDQNDESDNQNDEDDDDVDEIEEINSEGSEIADDDEDDQDEKSSSKKSSGRGRKKKDETDKDNGESSDNDESDDSDDVDGNKAESDDGDGDGDDNNKGNRRGGRYNNRRGGRGGRNRRGNNGGRRAAHRSRQVEVLGGTEYEDEEGGKASDRFRYNLRRQYKIQEVIKRGQIMLIQASREERGNKGAAVTTYLSLPGRYGVLMPNSPRAGGVSRKIAKFEDRQRMRATLKELDVPKGMSVILRTAGVTRTKAEIKRDIDYLMRLWDDIRERTLQSSAPAMIYEEADLIKRAVRDLYTRDVEEIQVSGDEGYDATKKFMKMMIPSHVKKVKEYKDDKVPLFHKYRVENQIAEINETSAKLKSGGYLVINPTEALVSIDVNSGRATKERHIEETALNTNMEAAEEVARQLRLRDLGGLVVIDFIDMEDRRNNAKVERKLKEALSGDRARIQIGRISSFGLLELSRQRLNPSLTEAQYDVCKHCEGRGVVRNADSTSIMLLRGLEEEGIKGRAAQLIVHVSSEVALYMLNYKRKNLDEIERRYGFSVLLRTDDSLGSDKFRIEVARPTEDYNPDEAKQDEQSDDNDDRNNKRKRGRRGGRGRGGGKNRNNNRNDDNQGDDNNADKSSSKSSDKGDDSESDGRKKQNKRGGKAGSSKKGDADQSDVKSESSKDTDAKTQDDEAAKAKSSTRGRKKKADSDKNKKSVEKSDTKSKDSAEEKPKKKAAAKSKAGAEKTAKDEGEKPKSAAKKPAAKAGDKKKTEDKAVKVPKASNDSDDDKNVVDPAEFETVNEPPKAKKKGWWNKLVD